MVSQLIFGECCELLESTKDWAHIRGSYDDTRAGCQSTQLVEIDEADYEKGSNALTPEWATNLEYNGHPMMVPLGSSLTGMKTGVPTAQEPGTL